MNRSGTYHRRSRIPTRMLRVALLGASLALPSSALWLAAPAARAQFIEVPDVTLPERVGGEPARLQSDPRGVPPGPPADMEELAARFFPNWRSIEDDRTIEVSATTDERIALPTTPGHCYAAIALGDSEGADVDLQVWQEGELLDEDLSRDHYPRIAWCATDDEAEVRVETFLDGPQSATLRILVDPRSVAASGEGTTLMERRMAWAAQLVVPRAEGWSEPRSLHFESPGILTLPWTVADGTFERAASCYGVVAVASPGIDEFDLLIEGETRSVADYRRGPIAALMTCEGDLFDAPLEIAVLRGVGEVRFRVFALSPR